MIWVKGKAYQMLVDNGIQLKAGHWVRFIEMDSFSMQIRYPLIHHQSAYIPHGYGYTICSSIIIPRTSTQATNHTSHIHHQPSHQLR